MIRLTNEERCKFVAWLRQDAKDNTDLAKQIDSLPGNSLVAKKYRIEAMAQEVVARKLESIENVSI